MRRGKESDHGCCVLPTFPVRVFLLPRRPPTIKQQEYGAPRVPTAPRFSGQAVSTVFQAQQQQSPLPLPAPQVWPRRVPAVAAVHGCMDGWGASAGAGGASGYSGSGGGGSAAAAAAATVPFVSIPLGLWRHEVTPSRRSQALHKNARHALHTVTSFMSVFKTLCVHCWCCWYYGAVLTGDARRVRFRDPPFAARPLRRRQRVRRAHGPTYRSARQRSARQRHGGWLNGTCLAGHTANGSRVGGGRCKRPVSRSEHGGACLRVCVRETSRGNTLWSERLSTNSTPPTCRRPCGTCIAGLAAYADAACALPSPLFPCPRCQASVWGKSQRPLGVLDLHFQSAST